MAPPMWATRAQVLRALLQVARARRALALAPVAPVLRALTLVAQALCALALALVALVLCTLMVIWRSQRCLERKCEASLR